MRLKGQEKSRIHRPGRLRATTASLCDPEGVASSREPPLPHLSNEHYHRNVSGLMGSLTEMTHLTGLVIRLNLSRYSDEILFLR